MNLKEWTKIFLTQRDLIKKEIKEIITTKEGFTLKTKNNKEKKVLVKEILQNNNVDIIISLNTKKNLETLINQWNKYTKQEKLILIFVCPEKNEKWQIKPHHHNKIADSKTLQQGLKTMFESITIVQEKNII